MSDHKDHITNLTPELMQQYQNGLLSSEMQHQVERYLLDHPFEAEAIEGVLLVEGAGFESDVADLKSRLITDRKEEKVIPLWQQYWKVAAVITVLVASTFIVLELNRTSELTQNELVLNEEVDTESEQELKETAPIVENDDEIASKISSDEEVLEEAPVEAEYSEEVAAEEQVAELVEEVVESDEPEDYIIAETVQEEEEAMADEPIKVDEMFDEAAVAEEDPLALVTRSEQARKSMAASGAALSNSDELAEDLGVPSRIVTGKITSSEDESSLSGVNVVVDGTTEGTITDLDGNYELVIPEGKEVVTYSFIGYSTEEVEIGDRSVLDLSLSADVSALSEVVVSGYSSKKKRKKLKTAASPIGGFDEFETYLKASLQYPQEAIENDITGTVVVEFLVDDTSKLADFEVTNKLGYGCDEEAIRLIKEGPKWQSAINRRGDIVEEKVKIEITFNR